MASSLCLVTGAAGFVGSHLSERLLSLGHDIIGVDCFSDYYSEEAKRRNLDCALSGNSKFKLINVDLARLDISSQSDVSVFEDAEFVFHLAGRPGVRGSWGSTFPKYIHDNIDATQKLLEIMKKNRNLRQFILASSSSVYGDAENLPTDEKTVPSPLSPYGVTKLACESLCTAYSKSYKLPTTILRYFTVYGPRQRPDMGFYKFIDSILNGREIQIYGDGNQTRDFTYVQDTVEANVLSMKSKGEAAVYNIGSNCRVSVNEVLSMMQSMIGKKAKISYRNAENGDAKHTSADISRAVNELGYTPIVSLADGLRKQIDWQMSLPRTTDSAFLN